MELPKKPRFFVAKTSHPAEAFASALTECASVPSSSNAARPAASCASSESESEAVEPASGTSLAASRAFSASASPPRRAASVSAHTASGLRLARLCGYDASCAATATRSWPRARASHCVTASIFGATLPTFHVPTQVVRVIVSPDARALAAPDEAGLCCAEDAAPSEVRAPARSVSGRLSASVPAGAGSEPSGGAVSPARDDDAIAARPVPRPRRPSPAPRPDAHECGDPRARKSASRRCYRRRGIFCGCVRFDLDRSGGQRQKGSDNKHRRRRRRDHCRRHVHVVGLP